MTYRNDVYPFQLALGKTEDGRHVAQGIVYEIDSEVGALSVFDIFEIPLHREDWVDIMKDHINPKVNAILVDADTKGAAEVGNCHVIFCNHGECVEKARLIGVVGEVA